MPADLYNRGSRDCYCSTRMMNDFKHFKSVDVCLSIYPKFTYLVLPSSPPSILSPIHTFQID